ncbi:hypothetical protein CYMTET_17127 [Cymbomonas tetramitiformis]|uniref:Uncharacterized protein n=1 Tax=Cymbomonas tetramitiformis TaxID=36881 RepID=A0AAE0L7L6_9CHLO|nr:hypothetical protein CYMTET_17127 [Cymbomonas tetramitiformis]
MMHEGLKNWLSLDATTGLCEPISNDNGGVVPAEVIASASERLAANAYKKVADLEALNAKLPAREKSGRKCKTKGAWHKQGPSPAKKAKKSSKSSSHSSKLAQQAKQIKQLQLKLKSQ